ncbi:small integral membrane protein 11A [Meleagris gallopavo]|uniref:small integral membrane protein 11A n=1 Tax=Meleagris gallopavo TaxID=9103 RepID=UPI000938FDAF|nr:small integral membrane protein 11A [Meleagris gallopavo]
MCYGLASIHITRLKLLKPKVLILAVDCGLFPPPSPAWLRGGRAGGTEIRSGPAGVLRRNAALPSARPAPPPPRGLPCPLRALGSEGSCGVAPGAAQRFGSRGWGDDGRHPSIWNLRGAAGAIVSISIAASADASVPDCAFRSVTLVGAGHSLLQKRHYQPSAKMVAFNLKALENFPLLMYILAAKTLILCLAFAGVKMYQSKKIEEKLKREREEKLKREAEKKGD